MRTHVTTGMQKISWGVALLGAGLLAGCGGGDQGPVPITETRAVGAPEPVPPGLTAADRLLPPAHVHEHEADPEAGTPALSASAGLTWTTPDGWTVGAARAMRLVTFAAGPDGVVECFIAELGGMGGGTEANFNRWRAQLGQPPLADGEFAALPTLRMLGQDAPLVEVEGTYRGMGETEQPGSKLLGTLAAAGERTFFVKLVGPAAAVDEQRAAFEALCASLKAAE